MPNKKLWYQQKTTWTCIVAIATAVGGALVGTLTWPVALPMISTALIGLFLRQGVEGSK